jgi:hypothetical protein
MLLKISIGVFFLRIVQSNSQRIIIYTAMACSSLFSIAMFLFAVFQCGIYHGPLQFILRKLTNQCASESTALAMVYTHAVVTMITDWTFLILPIWLLRRSVLSLRDKWIVGLFLAFASLSGFASIARFPYIYTLALPSIEFFGT